MAAFTMPANIPALPGGAFPNLVDFATGSDS
jgi:hypothetical protein